MVRFFSSSCSPLFPNSSILVINKRLFKTHAVQWYRFLVQWPMRKFRWCQVERGIWKLTGSQNKGSLGELSRVLDCLSRNSHGWTRSLCLSFDLFAFGLPCIMPFRSADCLNYVLTGNLVLWISPQQVVTVNLMLVISKSIEPVIFFPPKPIPSISITISLY